MRMAVDQLPDGFVLTPLGTPMVGQAERRALGDLRRRFVITHADKLSKNFVIVCRRLAVRALLADLGRVSAGDTPTYVRLPEHASREVIV